MAWNRPNHHWRLVQVLCLVRNRRWSLQLKHKKCSKKYGRILLVFHKKEKEKIKAYHRFDNQDRNLLPPPPPTSLNVSKKKKKIGSKLQKSIRKWRINDSWINYGTMSRIDRKLKKWKKKISKCNMNTCLRSWRRRSKRDWVNCQMTRVLISVSELDREESRVKVTHQFQISSSRHNDLSKTINCLRMDQAILRLISIRRIPWANQS